MPTQPQHVKFPLQMATEELERCNVYLLETFSDGMTRWGSDAEVNPFTGSSAVADTQGGTITFSDIRAVLNKLDRAGHFDILEERLLARLKEEEHGQ